MMKASLNYKDSHPNFKLNGIRYDIEGLKEVAYSLIKEGNKYEKAIGDFLSDWLDDKPTLEARTSGSTGKPKKMLLQKLHMVNSAIATGAFFDVKPGNSALLCLPADYIAGKMMLVRAIILGLELDFVEPSSAPLEQVQKHYDFCAMVPLQVQNSLDSIEKIKKLLVGGAPMSLQLKNDVQPKPTKVYETYGMTETITHVAIKTINGSGFRSSAVETSSKMKKVEEPDHFRALSNVTFSKDSRECLVIDAPKVSNEPVVTNDVVNLISKTEFEWLGRYDNIINSGGVKICPEPIEEKLIPFIEGRFFFAGMPDDTLGQKLILVVEGDVNTEELLQQLKMQNALEWFEIPKTIYKLPRFIETDTGKTKRVENLKRLNI